MGRSLALLLLSGLPEPPKKHILLACGCLSGQLGFCSRKEACKNFLEGLWCAFAGDLTAPFLTSHPAFYWFIDLPCLPTTALTTVYVNSSICAAFGICNSNVCISSFSGPCILHNRLLGSPSWLLSDRQARALPWEYSMPVFILCFSFSPVSGLRTPIYCPKLLPISEVK